MSIQSILETGLTGGGLILFVLLTIIQIAPIKINPWSAIARAIGNALNKDIKNDIKEIKDDMGSMKEDIQKIKNTNDERYAIQCRIRILRFNDELLIRDEDQGHSKDYYDQTLMDIDEYENYCIEHPEFKNNMTVFAINNIKRCYDQCMKDHKFLQM